MRMRLCRDEVGEYYAIDIGGTNFRSIHVTLSGNKGEVVRAHSADAYLHHVLQLFLHTTWMSQNSMIRM